MDGLQYAEQLKLQQEIEHVIADAKTRPITESEAQLLKWASGVH